MKLHHRLIDGLRLFKCRRSTHLIPTCYGRPRGLSADYSSVSAANDPSSWVLLTTRTCRSNNDDSMITTSSNTMAETHTSTGHRLRVSFHLAAPPAMSHLHYNCAETTPGEEEDKYSALNVIAAHGDSVLLRMAALRRSEPSSTARTCEYDHFLYRSGRRQSLSLLPDLKLLQRSDGDRDFRPLLSEDTGILRRGGDDGEFVVARIEVLAEHNGGVGKANLCVVRSRSTHWEHKRLVPIVHEEGDELMGPLSGPDMALPVGDRFLCWVGHRNCFILCDMADETSPKLRHVPLPVLPYDPDYYTNDLPPLTDSHSLGVAGTSAVRFVAIEPRCCCGGFGRCSSPKSRHAFTVTTWTLTLNMDEPIVWVKDTVLDCEELWALPGYEGIPRLHLQSPVVSLDNPDVVWFRVVSYEEKKAWMIQVDTRRKELLATVVQSTIGPWRSYNPCSLRQATLQ